MTTLRSLSEYFIFVLFGVCHLNIVLCHASEHVEALTDINGRDIQKDAVNAGMLKFCG